MKKYTSLSLLVSLLILALNSGCNIFEPFDDPTNPEQILSHARACFDDGDMKCALEEYAKISTGPYSDQANSEMAFAILDQAGATMGAFLSAIGNDKNLDFGGAVTNLSNSMGKGSLSKRKDILSAYETVKSISDPSIKALVRFTSALALAAEMLGEVAHKSGNLKRDDIASDGNTCADSANCVADSSCAIGSSLLANSGAVLSPDPLVDDPIDTKSSDLTGATVNMAMIQSAISAVQKALSDLGASGKFSSGLNFSKDITQAATDHLASAPECYRYTLIHLGVGAK